LKYPNQIFNTYGEGLIASIIFQDSPNLNKTEIASRVVERCMEKGVLLVHTGRESIKLGPPLIIDDEALLEAMITIDKSISKILADA
jgi:4-aminobutyrate aminotransferase-like enzyme